MVKTVQEEIEELEGWKARLIAAYSNSDSFPEVVSAIANTSIAIQTAKLRLDLWTQMDGILGRLEQVSGRLDIIANELSSR